MKKILALLFLLSVSSASHATFIQQDLITRGDHLATFDDLTGNLWLKASLTAGMTYDEVNYLLNNVYLYQGFHIATKQEVLSTSWGNLQGKDQPYQGLYVADYYKAFVSDEDLTGKNFEFTLFSQVFFDDPEPPPVGGNDWLYFVNMLVDCREGRTPSCHGLVSDFPNPAAYSDWYAQINEGWLLVKSVPEPAILSMLPLLLLLVVRRSRSSTQRVLQ